MVRKMSKNGTRTKRKWPETVGITNEKNKKKERRRKRIRSTIIARLICLIKCFSFIKRAG